MRRIKLLFCFWTLLGCCSGIAANLGNYGQVYPIAESDIIEWIHSRLGEMQEKGELKHYQEEVTKAIKAHVLRPTPTELPRTDKYKVSYYTPTFTVPKNIYDAQGKILFKAGTTVNVLDQDNINKISPYASPVFFNERLIFINVDDLPQVNFAKQEAKKAGITKIILVQGNIEDASRSLGRIYFDQGGTLVQRFQIKAVPTVISREGKRLKIEAIRV